MKREVASRIAREADPKDRTDASLDVLCCLKVRYLVWYTLHLRGIKRKDHSVFVNSSVIRIIHTIQIILDH